MGIRTFHRFFISLSVLLAAFVAAWATGEYRLGHQAVYVLYGAASVVSGGVMVVYGAAFQRKTRRL